MVYPPRPKSPPNAYTQKSGLVPERPDLLTLTAPEDGVTIGQPVLMGSLFVVPAMTAEAGKKFSAWTTGVFALPKTGAQAWVEGQLVRWNTAWCDVEYGHIIGVAAAAAENPSETGMVRLNGVATPVPA